MPRSATRSKLKQFISFARRLSDDYEAVKNAFVKSGATVNWKDK
jgi:hypothetical protein